MLWALALGSAIELAFVGWKGASLRHYRLTGLTRSKAADLFLTSLSLTGFKDIWLFSATFGTAYLAWQATDSAAELRASLPVLGSGSFLLDTASLYLLHTFVYYWSHRLFHIHPFWFLHRYHHSATEMSLFNAARHHPLHQVIDGLLMFAPIAILQPSADVIAVALSLHGFHQIMTHANMPHGWGWFGRWVLMSPGAHRVHHAREARKANLNFGTLVIWDRLFGTYAEPVQDIQIGIEDAKHNVRLFLFDLIHDGWEFVYAPFAKTRPHNLLANQTTRPRTRERSAATS